MIVRPVRARATVSAALTQTIFAQAFNAGQQLSLDEAFAEILASGHVLA